MREIDLDELLRQLTTVRRMGSLVTIMEMIPGLARIVSFERVEERDLRRFEAIVRSMTPFERRDPDRIDLSRIQRIAKGSGTSLRDVGDLLGQFHAMRKALRERGGDR